MSAVEVVGWLSLVEGGGGGTAIEAELPVLLIVSEDFGIGLETKVGVCLHE